MHRSPVIAGLLLATFVSSLALAAPKDKSANAKIDEAINDHYLETDFKKAEGILLGTIKACGEDGCSPEVLARAWMYVGIVRGSGKNDQKGAKKAFEEALELSSEVTLDSNLANPATQKTFEAVAKDQGVEPQMKGGKDAPDAEASEESAAEPTSEEDEESPGASAADEASCQSNGDCESGQTCEAGTCTASKDEEAESEPDASTGGYRNWVGLHVGFDFAFVGGKDVCAGGTGDTDSYACFTPGTEGDAGPANYFYQPVQPGAGGSIPSSLALGTTRVMLSFDRVFGSNVTLGARLGYAFGGGPQPAAGTKFAAEHIELRAAYWFGQNPFAKKLRPYVHVGAGRAQVDTKIENVQVRLADGNVVPLDAWHKVGAGFLTVGGGLVYGITDHIGIQGNVNAMLMLGDSGFVLQPSLGLVYGFGK